MSSSVPPMPPMPSPVRSGPPPVPGAISPMDEAPVIAPSIWQHPVVQNVLPFATSLLLHAGFILICIALVKPAIALMANKQEQIVVPSLDPELSDNPGGVENPGLGTDPNRSAAQDKIMTADATGWAESESQSIDSTLAAGGGDNTEGGASGITTGNRQGTGASGLVGGTGGGGPLAPFGTPGGGSGKVGPRCNFAGSGGNALTVAYVCDASGSMVSTFEDLRMEIRKSIDKLKPVQRFSIVFFQEKSASAFEGGKLVAATPQMKAKAVTWLDEVVPRSSTNPLPALEMVFKEKPDLMFLLTDGAFPDNEEVAKWLKEHNADKKVHINTLAFLPDNNERGECEKILKRIASENGGQFKLVSSDDLAGGK